MCQPRPRGLPDSLPFRAPDGLGGEILWIILNGYAGLQNLTQVADAQPPFEHPLKGMGSESESGHFVSLQIRLTEVPSNPLGVLKRNGTGEPLLWTVRRTGTVSGER